jgi:hypothetical protein
MNELAKRIVNTQREEIRQIERSISAFSIRRSSRTRTPMRASGFPPRRRESRAWSRPPRWRMRRQGVHRRDGPSSSRGDPDGQGGGRGNGGRRGPERDRLDGRARRPLTRDSPAVHENESNARLRVASSRAGRVLIVSQVNPPLEEMRWRSRPPSPQLVQTRPATPRAVGAASAGGVGAGATPSRNGTRETARPRRAVCVSGLVGVYAESSWTSYDLSDPRRQHLAGNAR